MQIGELAQASGMSREALRFYERRGLLRARRLPNGYRDYPPQSIALLALLRRAQGLGYSLAEIAAALQQAPDAQAVAQHLQAKLAQVDGQLQQLQALRQDLLRLAEQPCPLTTDPCPR